MQALTVKQPWASLVAYGEKTIEYRSWATDYRGPLLICAAWPSCESGGSFDEKRQWPG